MKKIFLIILSIFLISQNVAMADVIDKTTIPVGAYIQYKPNKTSYNVQDSGYSKTQTVNPSKTTKWKVFKNNNGQLDIISSDTIGEIYLQGKTGYKNVVKCLTALSNAYVNPLYATSGRALGTTSQSEATTDDTDEYYETDMKILKNNKSLQCSKYVWFGSRLKWSGWYSVRTYKDTENSLTSNEMYKGSETARKSHHVRPIVSLISNIEIADGDGTLENPYKIGFAISYIAEGAENIPQTQIKEYNMDIVLSDKIPTKNGTTFIEWNTATDGSGTTYVGGSTYSANESITLYAIWKLGEAESSKSNELNEENESSENYSDIVFDSNFLSNECYTMKTGYVFSNIRVSLDNYWTIDSIVKEGINLTVKEISGNTVSDVSSNAIVRVVNLRNSKNEIQDINEAYFRPGEYTIGIAIGGANLFTNTSSKYRVILDTFSIRNENVNLDFSTSSGNWFDVIVKDFQNLT